MDTQNTKKKARKPFKQTRDLVRLAINSGWTQQEIANKCRVNHQSIVSSWSKGLKYATEEQLQPLLKEFGYKLRRNSFKVYWGKHKETGTNEYYRVEGNVVFSQSIHRWGRDKDEHLIKSQPMERLIIHHYAEDKFRPISQIRARIPSKSSVQQISKSENNQVVQLESSVEDAIWQSEIHDLMTTQELLDWVGRIADQSKVEPPHSADLIQLPFLVRQSLLQHGFSVQDVVDYSIPW